MKRLTLYICALLIGVLAAHSATLDDLKQRADSAYLTMHYAEATTLYEQILRQTESPEVEYNLACAYYRRAQWAPAILHYERCLLLAPANSRADDNLALARLNTTDALIPDDVAFLPTLWWHIAGLAHIHTWQRVGGVAFTVLLLSLLVVAFVHRRKVRLAALSLLAVALLLTVLANVSAFTLDYRRTHSRGAIIMVPAVHVTASPSPKAKTRYTLHSGTRIELADTTLRDWSSVTLSDGREGWLPDSAYQRIR